jgi:hypothetical protein
VVEITPDGLAVLQALRTLIHRHEQGWMSSFSEAELGAYIATLHRIQDSVTTLTSEVD